MRIENEMKVRNFGIFKEISGYLGSLLEICAKLQLATLKPYQPCDGAMCAGTYDRDKLHPGHFGRGI